MLAPGTYHFITLGRRYVRMVEHGIVGNQMEHAEQFESADAALTAARTLKARAEGEGEDVKKPIKVQTVTITETDV